MQFIHAVSMTQSVGAWLTNSRHPRLLHRFDGACNLINERAEVLSVVTPRIGNGPFNLVVEDEVLFSEHLPIGSPITIHKNHLDLGEFIIKMEDVQLWNPRPDWEGLQIHQDHIIAQVKQLPVSDDLKKSDQLPITSYSDLLLSLANTDPSSAKDAASKLAGLGHGLTPAGDDIIMGALYAAWIIHPPEVARILAEEVANTAALLTTSLSAAWLRSAGRGKAGIRWHEFFKALISEDAGQIQETMDRILAIGATSGADALSGFMGSFSYHGVNDG